MRILVGAAAAASALLLAASGAVLLPADAAVLTSSGVRCTEVGTSGHDVLVGTSGRDVICGLGGNDTIKGLGGNDLIDAGAGSDTVLAGAGNDKVLGGTGADDISGGTGADVLAGGAGGDTITGGGSTDTLQGQDGNDDLSGGAGADTVNGGAGTNWCIVNGADTSTRCVYDREPPSVVGQVTVSKDTVDVTDAGQRISMRVHVTDDTGVSSVGWGLGSDAGGASPSVAGGRAQLVSGTIRDGWWEADSLVKRWSVPGTFEVSVGARDRLGRSAGRVFPDTLVTVKDRNPDTTPPVATLLRPKPDTTVDVRTARQDVVVRARITDAVSGVWHADLCLDRPQEGYWSNLPCSPGELVSGDAHDGIWQEVVTIPKGATGGDWDVEVGTGDYADSGDVRYVGPDEYRYWTNDGANPDPNVAPFADGLGRFSVIGSNDSTPAAITGVTLDPSSVDTLPGPASVTVRVHAVDAPGEGVVSVGGVLGSGNPDGTSDGTGPEFAPIDLTLVGGTDVDGTWQGTFDLPQGTPPGAYYAQLWVEDARHWRTYVASPSDASAQQIPGDSTVTVVEHTG